MQLHAAPAAKESEDDDSDAALVDLHVLVLEPISLEETDVIMEGDDPSPTDHQLHLFGANVHSPSTAVSNPHLEGENSLFDVIESATDEFAASSSSTSMLDSSNPPVPVLLPKLEENQSIQVKAEMYPPLPPPPEPAAAVTTPLPPGPVLINGIYYQPILAPHNNAVAQSAVPAPMIVPCPDEVTAPAQPALIEPTPAPAEASSPVKSPPGLEFTMPEMPSPKKSEKSAKGLKKAANQSRSNSRQREKRKSPLKNSPEVRPTSGSRGKKKVEMSNAPILIPTTHSHLLSTAKPRLGLTISSATDDSTPRSVKTSAVRHLSPLTTEAAIQLEVNDAPIADTAVT